MNLIQKIKLVSSFAGFSILLLAFQNCSPGFRADSSKQNSSQSVFSLEKLQQFDRGTEVFVKNCIGCHGSDVDSSSKRFISLERLNSALAGGVEDMAHLELTEQDKNDVVYSLQANRSEIVEGLTRLGLMPEEHISVCRDDDIESSLMRRLNRREYLNTVSTLFGVDVDPNRLPKDQSSSNGYDNNGEALLLFDGDGEKYYDIAFDVATAVSASDISFTKCADGSPLSEGCFAERVELMMYYVFRRTPTGEEVAKYLTFAEGDQNLVGYRKILTAALVSPHFLFLNFDHKALDGSGVPSAINDFEVVTRLALFLWARTPDKTLLDLAKNGEIRKPEILKAQVSRMLSSSHSDAFIESFTEQWLDLKDLGDRPKAANAELYRTLAPDMLKETQVFVRHILEENLPVNELITADYSFVNQRLAQHYQMSDSGLGEEFEKVTYPQDTRRGLLTHGSFLSSGHQEGVSIIFRGAALMDRVLCVSPPAVVNPGDINPLQETADAGQVDLVSQHSSNPKCASCHSFIDPLGKGLNAFSDIGAFRNLADISVTEGTMPDGTSFVGAEDLMGALAERKEFQNCVGEHLVTSALGRELSKDEKCYVREIAVANEGEVGMRDFILSLVKSKIFDTERTD